MGARGYLVIGAARGWGRLVALAAAGEGGRVVVCDHPGVEEPALGAAAAAGVSERIWYVPADVSSEGEAERLLEAALSRLPALHVVVIVSGAMPSRGLAELSFADWEEGLAAPLRGVGLVCRAAVEEFLAGGEGGRIVLVSPAVEEGAPAQARAASLGSALQALGRSVAKEYGSRGIACNVVAPSVAPGARGGSGLVEAVLFLASPDASYVNGECLRVGVSAAGAEAPPA